MNPVGVERDMELMGPPCEVEGCKGVLIQHITKANECFKRCSICKAEFGRMPLADKLGWARRTIERAVKGEKVS